MSASCVVRSACRLARLSPITPLASRQVAKNAPALTQAVAKHQSPVLISARTMATQIQRDSEIAKFLQEEIATEKQNQKLAVKLEGFEVKTEGAEVTLTKSLAGEKVVISLNVNHTVDSAEPDDGSGEAPEMLSRPNFEVDIVKANGRTLSFSCSYISADEMPDSQDGTPDDVYAIDEVTMFDGEDWNEKKYVVAGDILDGYLYDLFMNMLEDRGVDNAFVEKLSDYCSVHEHSQYINLLEGIEKFVKM